MNLNAFRFGIAPILFTLIAAFHYASLSKYSDRGPSSMMHKLPVPLMAKTHSYGHVYRALESANRGVAASRCGNVRVGSATRQETFS